MAPLICDENTLAHRGQRRGPVQQELDYISQNNISISTIQTRSQLYRSSLEESVGLDHMRGSQRASVVPFASLAVVLQEVDMKHMVVAVVWRKADMKHMVVAHMVVVVGENFR